MNSVTRDARDWVTNSTRSNFFDVIQEAKISPRQMQIIEMRFVTGLMNFQIASDRFINLKSLVFLSFLYRMLFYNAHRQHNAGGSFFMPFLGFS